MSQEITVAGITTCDRPEKPTILVDRIHRDDDLEIHVREVACEGLRLIDIREYIPSRGVYGHGIMFPKNLTEQVHAGIEQVTQR